LPIILGKLPHFYGCVDFGGEYEPELVGERLVKDADDFLVAKESDIGLNIKTKKFYHRNAVGHTVT